MSTQAVDLSQLNFDPDTLREKYRTQRDKRIHRDGLDQYQQPSDNFTGYVDDPYVEPGFTREALTDEVEVATIGGGFDGLYNRRTPTRSWC